jgi:catechol 2,3-dioxygenase-like lactoylglutathione lyase family enzyme
VPLDDEWAPIIPELVVRDFEESLSFYVDVLGFAVMYQRDDPPFVMLRLGRAQLMLERVNASSWITGEMEHPFGRGINLEIEHPDPRALERTLVARGVARFRPLTERTYETGREPVTQLQVLVQDPDGYLLRFASEG